MLILLLELVINSINSPKKDTKNERTDTDDGNYFAFVPVLFSIIKARTLVYVFAVITLGTYLITLGASVPDPFALIAVTTSSYLVALATYLYNDLTDFRVDQINRREIVHSNKDSLQYKTTLYSTITFFVMATALSFSINIATGISTLVFGALAVAYSHPKTRLKDMFIIKTVVTGAGAFVASLMGMTAAMEGGSDFPTVALMTSLIAFFFYFILGPLGDIGDIRGDRQGGRRTIPIVIGVKKTFILMGSIVVFIGVIFTWSHFLFGIHWWGLVLGVITCGVFLFQICDISKHYQIKPRLKKARTTLRYCVFGTMISMWIGTILKDIMI